MATKRITVKSAVYGQNTVLIEDADYSKVKDKNIFLSLQGGTSNEPTPSVKVNGRTTPLHRFILGKSVEGKRVYHKDNNKLNNTRKNLIID